MDLINSKKQLDDFLNGMSKKYLPTEIRPVFRTTEHFIERLLVDRADNLDPKWVSVVFSKLYHLKLCEFLYLLETTEHFGRINLQYQGRSIAMVKVKYEGYESVLIKLSTCYTGVALHPEKDYSILSLDEQNGDIT